MVYVAYAELVQHFEVLFTDPLFILYGSSVLVDIVLGNVKAWTNNDVDSNVGVRGTLKHLGVFTFVVVLLPPLTYYLGSSAVGIGVLTYLVYQYLISIVENLGELGFNVPTIFKEKLRRLDVDEVNNQDKENGE